ncbi:ABC transporter permease [Spirosoma montaniterrae]|uniref:Cell division protein FtsX n=1 Tax=Spirosoma montaniterrae TaxID=1178516 RepID=A0A1P9X0C8_9BACT|nr:ABC transporter permease [Spirosoma montaniterrae]AQG81072.1 cell division protein FtsX [Spirosoma montaniterrae]
MFRNYLKIALRTLRKQRGLTFINIFGLALGMACCLLIMLYVADELSYDRFHTKADRTYRLSLDVKFTGIDGQMATVSDPLGPTLKQDYPQVEQFTRLHPRGNWQVKRAGTTMNIREQNILFADSTVFDVFTLPLIAGDPRRALNRANTLVISETAARRHFGNADPMGKTLTLDNRMTFTITGVMRDIPPNSHVKADFLATMLNDEYNWGQWLANNHYTYIVLKEGTDPATFAKNLDVVTEKYVGPQLLGAMGISLVRFRQAGNRFRNIMMPITDIHLRSKHQGELTPPGDIQYVYIFSAVALFILFIACINFMNLATARSAGRAREVGVRKVLGSERGQLMGQFMAESMLTTILAMGLALILVGMSLPLFNNLAAKQIDLNQLLRPQWLAILAFFPLLVGLLAGVYPAFFLSGFRPIQVLKGKMINPVRGRGQLGDLSLRSGLVVFQFMMSVILIVGTLVIYRQITYIQNKNLGFRRDQVLIINDTYVLGKSTDAFRQEVLRLPGVVSGSVSSFLPVPSNRSNTLFFPEGQVDQSKGVSIQNWNVDHEYIKTMGMQMVVGRDFARSFGSDSSAILLNETAAKIFGGVKNVLGKRIVKFNDPSLKNFRRYTVIGVVKNFHYESLRKEIGALCLELTPDHNATTFRLRNADVPKLVGLIESKWKQMAPGQPFNYNFMDESFDQTYRAEQRIGTLALTFAVLAILIACLGLFGLATFTAEQRTKEIGIRKVLGASVASIVTLLSKDFLKLVLVAIVIASPVAWYAMHRWLADFAYRIEIEWWVFALAGMLAVGIALLTVSFQSIKAAVANPVKSLRSE